MEKKSFREEMVEMLDIFDYYGITEKKQRKVVTEGVDFNYTWGDIDYNHENKQYDCFKFARFLVFCKNNGYNLNANRFLDCPTADVYKPALGFFEAMDKKKAKKAQEPGKVFQK